MSLGIVAGCIRGMRWQGGMAIKKMSSHVSLKDVESRDVSRATWVQSRALNTLVRLRTLKTTPAVPCSSERVAASHVQSSIGSSDPQAYLSIIHRLRQSYASDSWMAAAAPDPLAEHGTAPLIHVQSHVWTIPEKP